MDGLAIAGPDRTTTVSSARWRARLSLAFERRGDRTVLARAEHEGPLRVQRPLAPEGAGHPHVYVLHPPGGVVGGDALTIDVRVHEGASALVTTPGSSKLYRSRGPVATIENRIDLGASSALEWLPQETIAFCGARASTTTHVSLASSARFIGWDILCLGRPVGKGDFARGHLRLAFELDRAGAPLFYERSAYEGGSTTLTAPWGLGGASVVGVLVALPFDRRLLDDARDAVADAFEAADAPSERVGLTCVGDVLIARVLASRARHARRALELVYRFVRPHVLAKDAVLPRIWAT
jgi:urease accessory protein